MAISTELLQWYLASFLLGRWPSLKPGYEPMRLNHPVGFWGHQPPIQVDD